MGIQPSSHGQSLRLAPVTRGNWRSIHLVIPEEQRPFVLPPAGMMAKAYAYRGQRARMLLIQKKDTTVGCLLVRYLNEQGGQTLVLDQFLISQEHQRKGYGLQAMQLLLRSRLVAGCTSVVLCVIDTDTAAQALYARCGFVRQPEEDDGNEWIMRLKLPAKPD